jgi:hypothetical protein
LAHLKRHVAGLAGTHGEAGLWLCFLLGAFLVFVTVSSTAGQPLTGTYSEHLFRKRKLLRMADKFRTLAGANLFPKNRLE